MAGRKNTRVDTWVDSVICWSSNCTNFNFYALHSIKKLFLGISVLAQVSVLAQSGLPEDSVKLQLINLGEITVNASSLSSSNNEYGGLVGIISPRQIALANPTIITDELNKISGVYMHSGALNTNRITIRGIGSRTPFATNKIRAYFGDIPLTDGGGETTLEDIDLTFIGSMEIMKGPNSSQFGSGLGGTIFLKPPTVKGHFIDVNSGFGSYGLLRLGALTGFQKEKTKTVLGYQRRESDGYRNNNSSDRESLFGNLSLEKDNDQFELLFLHLKQKAFIPSSLGLSDYENEPTLSAFTWGQSFGFEEYSKTIIGGTWKHQLSENEEITSSLYATYRNAYEPRPFNILKEKSFGYGVRSRWQKTKKIIRWSVGFEGYSDRYKWKIFENLYQKFNTGGSVEGELLADNKEQRGYFNLFAAMRAAIWPTTHIEAGANFNKTNYSFSKPLRTDHSFDGLLSPRISLTQGLGNYLNIYGAISQGFSPPSVDETLTEEGTFNKAIQPETGWNREIGLKAYFPKWSYEVAYYSIDVENLLVTRRTAEDVVFGENAGRTLHKGLEIQISGFIIHTPNFQLKATGVYSANNYRFIDFEDDGDDFSGNELTGVPDRQMNLGLAQDGKSFFSGFSYQSTGVIPVTDDNLVFTEKYTLFNLYVGYRHAFKSKVKAQVVYRLNNVFDTKYASMLSINAQAFGASEPRYYYPGLPRNHQWDFKISYSF